MDKGMQYRTVRQEAAAELIEKRSRFIAYVKPVQTEPDALDFLNAIRAKHRDATHNVYAYVLADNHIERFSDDGEPGGTAGLPTLEVIKKEGLTDVIVVVTRYFGGTLLGAGGLVRAYGKSAREGLLAAQMITLAYCYEVQLSCSYELFGKLRYFIETNQYRLGDILYGADVTLPVYVRHDRMEEFTKGVTEAVNGAVTPVVTGEAYFEYQPQT